MKVLPVLFLTLLSLGSPLAAQLSPPPDPSRLVMAEVSSSADELASRKVVTIAVKLKIEDDWHIYWLNPGDAGQQTAFKLTLPAGWKQAGEWQYPLPVRFAQPGGFESFGYLIEAVFLADVTPPADWDGSEIEVGVDVIYLVCQDVCIPGHLQLKAKVKKEAATGHDFAFHPKMPIPAPQGGEEGTSVSGTLSKTWSKLTIEAPGIPNVSGKLEVFPRTPGGIDIRGLKSELRGNRVFIEFEMRLLAGEKEVPQTFPLLVVQGEGQARTGKWINVPLLQSRP